MNYYLNLSKPNNQINVPKNIQNEILTLNNIESTLEIKRNEILVILNLTLNETFESQKNNIINKYINDIISDDSFKTKISWKSTK